MAVFSALLDDFSKRLGLDRLVPTADGVVELTMEQAGRLQLEENAGEWLLVTLARPYDMHSPERISALLDAAHWRNNAPWTLHPGMKGDEWLTLTARLPLETVDISVLEQVVSWLVRESRAVLDAR